MKNIDFKKLIPHIAAVVIFLGIALTYFYPVLEGYKLKQGDIQKFQAMSHEAVSHQQKYDEHAFWSGNMFGGMPTFVTRTIRFDYNIITYFQEILRIGLPHPASILFLYLIGFYILLCCLKVNPWLSIVGAVAFALSSYFIIIIEAGHNSKAMAIAYMAPILGGLIKVMRGEIKVGFLLISIFTALELYSNHLQITYYFLLVLLAVVITYLVYAIKQGEVKLFSKRISFAILAGVLGLLTSLGNILITYQYSKESTRGKSELTINPKGESNEKVASSGLEKDYITQWSYGIDETLTLLIPNAKGGASVPILANEEKLEEIKKEDPEFFNVLVREYQQNRNAILEYFGNQPIVEGPVYIGVIVLLFALLGIVFVRHKLVVPLVIITILSILLSWGKNWMPLTEFFIDYVPGYNKFRAVAMILLLAEFAVPILAILFLNKLINKREDILAQKKKLYITIGSFVGLLLLIYLTPGSFVETISDKEKSKYEGAISSQPNQANAIYTTMDKIEEYREAVVSSSAMRGLQLTIIAIAIMMLFLFSKVNKNILIVTVGVLILGDLWFVDKQYLNNEKNPKGGKNNKYLSWESASKQKVPFNPTYADQYILQKEIAANPSIQTAINNRVSQVKSESKKRIDNRKMIDIQYSELMESTHFRVLNTTARLDQDAQTPYFLKTLGGYNAAKLRKYQEFVDFHLLYEHYRLQQAFAQGGAPVVQQLMPGMRMTNMLNAKYIIGPDVSGKQENIVVENPYAYGNAWFVNDYKVVESPDSAIMKLREINPRTTIVVEDEDAAQVKGKQFTRDAGASISLTDYSPNKLSYTYKSNSEQIAVFSEIIYSPGWKVLVNGKEVEQFKVNYILRGLVLPAGEGTVEFSFEPILVEVGEKLTWAASSIFLVLIFFVGYSELKAKKDLA